MNALIAGTILFGTINLVFFGGLHIIMELADRRRNKVHMCTDRGSWCEHCLDDKQRAGIVNIYGKVIA
jgi:hypothetical protein